MYTSQYPSCKKCKGNFLKGEDMKQHLESHSKLECNLCKFQCLNHHILKSHVKKFHGKQNGIGILCKFCRKLFNHQKSLRRHLFFCKEARIWKMVYGRKPNGRSKRVSFGHDVVFKNKSWIAPVPFHSIVEKLNLAWLETYTIPKKPRHSVPDFFLYKGLSKPV